MSVDRTGIQDVHALWLQTSELLPLRRARRGRTCCSRRDDVLDAARRGGAGSGGGSAVALANAERRRLRKADLFYITREAAASVAGLTGIPCIAQIASIVPSPSGLVVWEEPPAHIERGVLLRAVS
ncbi:hypothetical protein SALBM311S_11339 [Streptomyces alboniger]